MVLINTDYKSTSNLLRRLARHVRAAIVRRLARHVRAAIVGVII